MTIYRTTNYGGVEGRDLITRNYISEEAATKAAKKDTWGNSYKLYKVDYMVDEEGRITEKETFLKKLKSGRDEKVVEITCYMLINKKHYVVHSNLTKEELATYADKIKKYGWTVKDYKTLAYKE